MTSQMCKLARAGALAMAGVLAVAATTPAALAQHPVMAAAASGEKAPALPEQLSKSEVRDVVSRLSDNEVRDLLIAQLDKVATAEQSAQASTTDALMVAGDRARDRLLEILASAPRVPGALGAAWSAFTADGQTGAGRVLIALLLAIVATLIAERLFLRMTGAMARDGAPDAARGLAARCGILALRTACDLLAIGIGLMVAIGVLFALLSGNEDAPLVLARVLGTFAVVRGGAALSRGVLAPRAAWLRAVPVDDRMAKKLHANVVAVIALWTLSGLPPDILQISGTDPRIVNLAALVFSAVLIAGLIVMVLRAREPMALYIRGKPKSDEGAGGVVEMLASRWHVLVATYLVGLWVLALGVKLGTGEEVSGRAIASLLLLVALPIADGALRGICAWVFAPAPADPAPARPGPAGPATAPAAAGTPGDAAAGDDEPTVVLGPAAARPPAGQAFERAMLRNVRILLALVAVLAFATIWDLNLQRFAEGLVGGRLAASLFEILLTLILAYAVWSMVKAGVSHLLGERPGAGGGDDDGEQEIGGPGLSRVATLLPLLRTVVAVVLLVMVVMIVLSALGVNIGPLLAGAGMLGLAVGFGAQTLVKDVISGFFFLLDDAFRMGEYVEVDAIRGSVEHISVRSLQMRHHNGPVHTLPFGDIRHITNYSRDWAIMKFELRLPFETDINKVRKIIKGVGQEMMEDEALSQGLLQPLKSQGVNRMDDSALIVRCKFTSKPGEQFVLRREAYTRIQQALAAAGIQFAPRRVIVETSDGHRPTPGEIQAAADSTDTPAPAAGGAGPG